VVIDCTGIAAPREGRLPLERFQQAKGEILALRIPGLAERRTIHHGLWLAHWRDDLFRAGATYSWNDPDDSPSEAGRNEIETRLKMFLKLPFETVGHHAATRPIAIDRKPIVERLANGHWALNGLGSKGALLAPRLAQQLAEALRCGG
jgi:glycine/D-amino acid oxidase-like deaminating enzyme